MFRVPVGENHWAVIDHEDADRVLGFRWRLHRRPQAGKFYAYGKSADGKTIYLHRLIMDAPVGRDVDHINGDGLDNRRCNLRVCTRSQNLMNRRTPRPHGFRGVSIGRRKRNYVARLQSGRRRLNLGTFPTPIEAARAYDAAAKRVYGDFAQLNFTE